MKKPICTALLVIVSLAAFSQERIDRMYIDTRAIFHQEVLDGAHSSQFKADHLNLNVFGHINERIDYLVRQRLNKKVFDENNIFNATDFLYINWQASPRWEFMVGKDAVLIGGYEYDAVPIDVYFYSRFCDNLYQGFTLGVSAKYQFIKGQKLAFQICNSPLSLGIENVYAYNFGWIGSLMPWWETIWTFNLVEDSDKRLINYIALGNHFQWGSLLFDLDFLNRASFRQEGFFLTDYSIISKVIWNVGKWNICAKGGYEENSLKNVDAQGRAFDNVIAPGTRYIYAGAGLEYFPLGLDKLRLHAVYYLDNDVHRHNFDIGLTWKVSIIGK